MFSLSSSFPSNITSVQAYSHRCGVRGKNLQVNPNCSINYAGITTATPSVTQRALLFGRFGFALYMNSSGTLGGTSRIMDKNSKFLETNQLIMKEILRRRIFDD